MSNKRSRACQHHCALLIPSQKKLKSFYFVNVSNSNYTIGLLRGQEGIGKVSNYDLLNVFLLSFFMKWVPTTTQQFACYSSIFQIFVPRFCFENLT